MKETETVETEDQQADAFVARITNFPSNGDAPSAIEPAPLRPTIGEIIRKAVLDLGEAKVDPDLATQQLRQLGEAVEEITRRKAEFDARSDEAKTAKKGYEGAVDHLVRLATEFTHPTPLPLFDASEREDDQQAMESAASAEIPPPPAMVDPSAETARKPMRRHKDPTHAAKAKQKSGRARA